MGADEEIKSFAGYNWFGLNVAAIVGVIWFFVEENPMPSRWQAEQWGVALFCVAAFVGINFLFYCWWKQAQKK